MASLGELLAQYEEETAFLRRFAIPEEDRKQFTWMPRKGGNRIFRAKNVIPIETARRLRDQMWAVDPDRAA
jgi:hypothetical protein